MKNSRTSLPYVSYVLYCLSINQYLMLSAKQQNSSSSSSSSSSSNLLHWNNFYHYLHYSFSYIFAFHFPIRNRFKMRLKPHFSVQFRKANSVQNVFLLSKIDAHKYALIYVAQQYNANICLDVYDRLHSQRVSVARDKFGYMSLVL
jgi:hypothetical protein